MSEAPRAPTYAEIEPPPGAGLSDAVSCKNVDKPRLTNFESLLFILYSIIFSLGSNKEISFNPIDFIAIFMISISDIPVDLCCLIKKYFPASNIDFNGIKPTNSEPVTLTPLF